ncbi:hypothetical protein HDU83_007991 [Entophlyctis luteolus]|nr:hypothetical protein HDU83_007991 [Entophlyctis luteolus]
MNHTHAATAAARPAGDSEADSVASVSPLRLASPQPQPHATPHAPPARATAAAAAASLSAPSALSSASSSSASPSSTTAAAVAAVAAARVARRRSIEREIFGSPVADDASDSEEFIKRGGDYNVDIADAGLRLLKQLNDSAPIAAAAAAVVDYARLPATTNISVPALPLAPSRLQSVSTSDASSSSQPPRSADITNMLRDGSSLQADEHHPARVTLSKSASSSALMTPLASHTRSTTVSDNGPIMRDRYGFARSFQYISRQDYIAFDYYYTAIETRRAAKWEIFLRKYAPQLPPRSDKLKRYIRKGIPHHLRESCWFHYSGAEKLMRDNSGLYSLLTSREVRDRGAGYSKENHKILEFIEVLERDLHRTFPDNILFNLKTNANHGDQSASTVTPADAELLQSQNTQQTQHVKSLRKVLVAFAYYTWPHPDDSRNPPRQCSYRIGYCQSLNFVAGLILLVFLPNQLSKTTGAAAAPAAQTAGGSSASMLPPLPVTSNETDSAAISRAEERAFWMLVAVVEQLLPPEMYGASLEGAQVAQEVLWKWLLGERGGRFGVGKVAKWVGDMEAGDGDGGNTRRSRGWRNQQHQQHANAGAGMPPLSLVTTSWFMTVFINVLPIETVLRVWDCFCYQGEKVLMRVTLTLLKIHEDEVLACSDTTDAWRLIKEIPPRMIDAHKLMDICFKPRVTLKVFDGGPMSIGASTLSVNTLSDSAGSRSHRRPSVTSSNVSIRSVDSEDNLGGGGSRLMIANDPLRKFSEKLARSGGGGGGGSLGGVGSGSGEGVGEGATPAAGGKVPRRGVGSVSTKLIEHYRAVALAERRAAAGRK